MQTIYYIKCSCSFGWRSMFNIVYSYNRDNTCVCVCLRCVQGDRHTHTPGFCRKGGELLCVMLCCTVTDAIYTHVNCRRPWRHFNSPTVRCTLSCAGSTSCRMHERFDRFVYSHAFRTLRWDSLCLPIIINASSVGLYCQFYCWWVPFFIVCLISIKNEVKNNFSK